MLHEHDKAVASVRLAVAGVLQIRATLQLATYLPPAVASQLLNECAARASRAVASVPI
jgi:hypothetical protein